MMLLSTQVRSSHQQPFLYTLAIKYSGPSRIHCEEADSILRLEAPESLLDRLKRVPLSPVFLRCRVMHNQ